MLRKALAVAIVLVGFAVAYQIEATRAAAEVDHGNPGPVLMAGPYAWGADGTAWSISTSPPNWVREPSYDLPFPADAVAMIDWGFDVAFVTTTGEGYVRRFNAWQVLPAFPGGPVALEQQSWGQVKGAYR